MRVRSWISVCAIPCLLVGLLTSCSNDSNGEDPSTSQTVDRLFPTADNPGEEYPYCIFNSPKWYESGDEAWVIVARSSGVIEALNPDTGVSEWSIELPFPQEGVKFVLATPAMVDDRLVVAYHAIEEDYGDHLDPNDRRLSHLVAVVDLDKRGIDETFPLLELEAEVPLQRARSDHGI